MSPVDTFQWERCEPDETGCVDRAGETGPTYLQVAGDVAHRMGVRAYRDGVLVGEAFASADTAAAPGPPSGIIRFEDHFETENALLNTYFGGIQAKQQSRLTLVTSPVTTEAKSLRVECRAGDNNVAGSGTGERAETLVPTSHIGGDWGLEGHDDFIGSSVIFAPSFPYPASTLWNSFWQLHAAAGGTQASTFAVTGGKVVCVANGGANLTDKPFNRATLDAAFEDDSRYDFVKKAHWSSGAGGYFDVWWRKNLGIIHGPVRVSGPNKYATDTGLPYPKIGVYRAPGLSATAVLEYGRLRICETFDDAADAVFT